LCADQLAPLVRLAEPDTDQAWAEDGPGLTAAQLRRLAAARRRVAPEAAAEQHRRRSVRWWNHERSGMVRLSGRLEPEAGAIVTKALNELAEQAGPCADGRWEPFESRCADALVELATGGPVDTRVPALHLHATLDALTVDGRDVPTLEDGTALAVQVARRLACDALRRVVVETADGVIRLGRTQRIANRHQRRRLRQRDPTCRFPGCDRWRRLQVHHKVHWADGGETDDDELLHLCPVHHRFVHDHGWSIRGDPTRPDGLVFVRPDGRTYQPGPHGIRVDLLDRFLGRNAS
jgi:hypothetical protein